MSSVTILLVDDYEPWRRYVCTTLKHRRSLHVIGEAENGLEAVEKAVELRPHLILLDIGLPKLNGIEAARQIRQVAPKSKILFLSQESSPDVVQEALSVGVRGYVVKSDAESDLLTAVEALLQGKQFTSARLMLRSR